MLWPSIAPRLVSFIAAGVLAGCSLWRPSTVPMRILREPTVCPARPDTLMVMLPGSYSLPEDFVAEGFVDAVHTRGIATDLWLVDAHRGYYGDRSILERLRADVIEPARAAGYRHLWFAGISIGAFGSMLYAQMHPGEIDGIVAIGPYLGERPIAAQIEAQGGLAAWHAPATPGDDEALWGFLQQVTRTNEAPVLLLGYGVDDRFGYGDRLLAAALPGGRVHTAPGGHEWSPWRATWAGALDAAPLPRERGCERAPSGRR